MIDLKNRRIILASQSPRRQELLKDLGLDFIIKSAHLDESFPVHLEKEQIPMYLAAAKANAMYSEMEKHDILITADTIVWLNNRAINKPEDRADAYHMIKELSGNKHMVYTGVQISTLDKIDAFFAQTEVYFSDLSDDEINYYLDVYKPYDKAGAYGIQEWIGYVGIHRINGSYFNVMGLPIHQVYQHLKVILA